MTAPIVKGVIDFVSSQANITVWDGEIPRYDTAGNAINPEATSSPTIWPVFDVSMSDAGFRRTWTMADPYDDQGEILLQIWGTTRAQVESAKNTVEALLVNAENWQQIQLGGPAINPFYVIQMLLSSWCIVQEQGLRSGLSKLLYRCDMHLDTMIHGIISTF